MARKDEQIKPKVKPAPRRRRHGRVGFGMVMTLTIAGLLFSVLILSLSGRSVPVPEFVRASVEDRVNSRLDGAPLSLGAMKFAVGRDGVPRILMSNIRLADLRGGAVAELNRLAAALSPGRLLRGEVAASNLYLTGAQITIRRTADGSFAFRSDQVAGGEAQSLPDLLERIDTIMDTGALASLQEVNAGGVVITLEDARSGRIWQATNASAILRKNTDGLTLSVVSDVFNGTDEIARMQLSLSRNRTTGLVSLGFAMTDMPATDIALQSPVLSWLGVLDAQISGSVRTELDESGALVSFAGTLDIAAGALQPTEDVPPAEFDGAKAYFTFDPGRQRIDFSEVTIASAEANLRATGYSYLSELDGPWPRAFLGQFRVEQLDYAGGGVLQGPLTLDDIRADLRLRLDPFSVELAQVVIDNQGTPVRASGLIEAGADGWRAAIDATSERIASRRVLDFWPVQVSPVTRGWISRNLREGTVVNPAAAVRFQTGRQPDISLSFEFQDGVARFLPDMPLLTGAGGRAAMIDEAFTLTILEGGITAETGGRIDISGSVFSVPDVRPRPATGVIDVVARGTLTGALSVLNNPPLRIMERANRPVDIAQADASVRASISLPLADGVTGDDVTYKVSADLADATSDTLVQGRVFASDALRLTADNNGITVDGPASLDGVPLTASWRQPLGEAAKEGGTIAGTIALSPQSVAAFDLPLPDGMLRGAGQGDYRLTLPVGAPPELTLTSSLRGVTLSLPSLGWSKPAGDTGALEIAATLGDVPDVRLIKLTSPGLTLDGSLSFGPDGFAGADFSHVRIGDWLDAQVSLIPRGAGADPLVALTGGWFDLRRFDTGDGGSGGGNSPIDVRLDTLVVSDNVALSPVSGRIEQSRLGLTGDFEGRINGNTLVRGSLAPANAGTAIRLQSTNAAGVLRDAGLTPNAREGTLDLVLTPVVGAPSGTYDGQFLIEDVRLRKAPVMADLLDAISVVGLLDQLEGPGIKFETVDGRFRLTRQRLTLSEAAAVGGSIGISADGSYDMLSKEMDFRGVISPVYFLNGIGSILTRRGEGLFGFNYRMTGSTEDPRVGVNPLSIFTPGAFRQIFRRAPPGSE